jgi:hypothetical protein
MTSTPAPAATDAAATLQAFVDQLTGRGVEIAGSLGAALGLPGPLRDAQTPGTRVRAVHIDPSSVLSIYALLGRGIVLYKRDPDGTIVHDGVPLTHVRRSTLQRAPDGTVEVVIELDAGIAETIATSEYREAPLDPVMNDDGELTDPPGAIGGQLLSRHQVRPAGWVLHASPANTQPLTVFHCALQAALLH